MPSSSSSAITATPTSSGTYQVSRGGSVIGTGSADYATALGATIPSQVNPNADFQNHVVTPTSAASPSSSPVQQTTTNLRTTAANNNATLATKQTQVATMNQNNANAQAAANTPVQQPTQTPASQTIVTGNSKPPATGVETLPNAASVVSDSDNGDGTHTVTMKDGTTERVQVNQNQDGTSSYTALSPEAGVKYDTDASIATATEKNQQEVAQANATLDSISGMADSATAALITSIQQTYAARISAMEDTNKRILSATTESGYRSGTAQYAPQINAGILTDQEQQGINRVAQLNGEMLSAIAQAQSAQTSQDLDIFNDRMTTLSKLDDELQTTVSGLQKNAIDELQNIQTANKNAFDEQQTQQQNSINTAKAAAPALAQQLNGMNPADAASLISETATQLGIDPKVLMGEISTSLTAEQQDKLNMQNIQSEMTARTASTQNSAENTNIAKQRLALDQKTAADKAPTSGEVFSAIDNLISPSASGVGPDELPGATYTDPKTGYLTPDGFSQLVAAAGENGVSKATFISQYSGKLDPDNYKAYGLTKAEIDALTDTSKTTATPVSTVPAL